MESPARTYIVTFDTQGIDGDAMLRAHRPSSAFGKRLPWPRRRRILSRMTRSSMAYAALLATIVLPGAAGCGVAFLATTDDSNADKDGGTTLLDSSTALTDGGSVPPPGDGASTVDAQVIDTCPQLGATRACAFADKSSGVQTCTPQASGPSVWSDCVSTSCTGAVAPSGAAASCIPAGTFDMGGITTTTAPEPDTLPAHSVKMQHRFYMDQYEVSVGEFASWWNGGAAAHPAIDTLIYVSGSGDVRKWNAADDATVAAPGTGLNCNVNANKPLVSINCVTQATALAYCVAKKGRLPTEAEWEFAASGQGQGNAYPWAPPLPPTAIEQESCLLTIDSICVNGSNGHDFPFARPSAAKGNTSVAMGSLNNLAGNVAEWTLDFAPAGGAQCASGSCWPSGASDPWASKDNTTGSVVRGGSYLSTVDQVRTKARAFASAVTPAIPASIGFRCVRTD